MEPWTMCVCTYIYIYCIYNYTDYTMIIYYHYNYCYDLLYFACSTVSVWIVLPLVFLRVRARGWQSVAGVQASTEPGHIQCYHECLLQRTGGTWAYTAFGLTLFTPAWSCVFSLTIYRIPACIAARQTSWNNCLHLYRSDLIGKVRSASSTHSKRQGCLTSCDKHITNIY